MMGKTCYNAANAGEFVSFVSPHVTLNKKREEIIRPKFRIYAYELHMKFPSVWITQF